MTKDIFQKVVAHTQKQQFPNVNVADAVLEMLASNQYSQQQAGCRPLVWVASLSSAIAACIAFAAYFTLQASSGSAMSEVYQAISWVAQ